jgi:hypothetical protein
MKMTIVIDSEDVKGIEAALSIAKLMHSKYGPNPTYTAHRETFGKIEFIKTLRKFMKESMETLKDPDDNGIKSPEDMANLRNAKLFADRIFRGDR